MKPAKFYIFALACILITSTSFTYGQEASSVWKVKLEPSKLFIENQGQFYNTAVDGRILYAYDEGSTMIYFSEKGTTYAFLKRLPREKKEKEEECKTMEELKQREAEHKKIKCQIDVAAFNWLNCNEDVKISATDAASEYFSYAFKDNMGTITNKNFVKGYHKITYKNLYPNIDVEYTFHPESGIKYILIAHPGADLSQVQMAYNKDVIVSVDGMLHVGTVFGDVIEHAPVCFYQDGSPCDVNASFLAEGKIVSFKLDAYDNSKTLIIDPWVQTPTLTISNGVWECERDGAGNVYIIGGDTPLKLLKYNAAGALQWTYTTPFDTTAGDWLGTFATDLAGNSYVTNGSSAELEKVNTAGGMVFHVNGGGFDEYWNIAFNCDQTKLIIGGTRLSLPIENSHGVIFDINTSNGSVNSLQNVGTYKTFTVLMMPQTVPNEVRSITSSYNARYYYLTLDSIGAIDQNFGACPGSSNIFRIPHTYSFGYKCETYRPDNGNSGIMSVRANRYFVYTQNGTNVHKRSLANGSILASAAIPGGASSTIPLTTPTAYQVENSGLDIDSCGNVYAGSSTGVIKYGANLNLITSYATSYKVFDVTVTNGGNLIICGATGDNSQTTPRTGYVEYINMSTCNPLSLFCCDANICPVSPVCSTDPAFNLNASTGGGTWTGTGITNPSNGTFNPATAGVGTHWVYYTLPCGMDSVQVVVNLCATLTLCQEINGDVTVTGGTGPYTWYDPTLTEDCSQCLIPMFCQPPAANCPLYVINWSSFGTGSTITPTGDTIMVIDNSSNSDTIYSVSSLPFCTSCPPITSTPSNIVGATCNGYTDGSFGITVSGGADPYDYTLTLGGSTVTSLSNVSGPQLFTGLGAGNYTLYIYDNNNCGDTVYVTITEPAPFSVNITGTLSFCQGSSTTLDAGGPFTTYAWTTLATSQTIVVTAAGTYTVTVTNGSGCPATDDAVVTYLPSPTVTFSPQSGICLGASPITLSGGSPVGGTYWGPGVSSGSFNPTTAGLGTHTLYYAFTNGSGCSDTASQTITVYNNPDPTINPAGPYCSNDPAVTLSGATPGGTWSGNGITDSVTGTFDPSTAGLGSHVITYSFPFPCAAQDSITIVVSASGDATITPVNPICIFDAAFTLNAADPGGVWSGTGITNTANGTFDPSVSGAGTFTIIYTISGSCGDADTVDVEVVNAYDATITPAGPFCSNEDTLVLTGADPGGIWTVDGNTNNGFFVPGIIGAGTHQVIYTISGSCGDIDTTEIVVYPTQLISGIVTNESCEDANDGSIFITISNGTPPYSISWNNGDVTTEIDSLIPALYTVVVVDSNGCINSGVFSVIQSDIDCYDPVIYVPNIFSPNGDGINDVLFVHGRGIRSLSFIIYDRWGEKVFETTDETVGWDGTFRGKPMESAVFMYYLKATFNNDEEVKLKGSISIVR